MNKVSFFISVTVAVLFNVISASSVQAQDQKIEQAVKHRKAAFTLMATYVNRLVQTTQGQRPFNSKQALADAQTMELLAALPWEGFVDGSSIGITKAKPDIWLEREEFDQLALKLQSAVKEVRAQAQSGDLARLTKSVGAMRDVCAKCHKQFRLD